MDKLLLKNPIVLSDVPDVDVLRHGDSFYMVSTTMHVMPGCPIMKSKDLVNWQIQSYIYDIIDDNEAYRLENGKHVYGRGQWATSLRYNEGTFYACFVCNDMNKTYIYHTKDIESGNWDRFILDGIYHDPSLLFEDGRLFIIYNCGDVRITELKSDASGVLEGGVDRLLFSTPKENIGLRCEGCHAYKINGYYYLLFIEWPSDGLKRRREVCYRSKELLGEYERKIVLDDDGGYQNKGIAQGAIFDSEAGDYYAMLFQDVGSVGRIPYIMPVEFVDGWPMPGTDGKVLPEFIVPFKEWGKFDMVISDDFNYNENKLALNWQWNHNPDNDNWSFTERSGCLRLTNGRISKNVLEARNTLTQRTEIPHCECITALDTSNMKNGDRAGLIALQSNYGTVGIHIDEEGNKFITKCKNSGNSNEEIEEKIEFNSDKIYLKIDFDYEDSRDIATFFYSLDDVEYIKIGNDLQMLYTLDHFMGYRIGLYSYATLETKGMADFEFFRYKRY
jgi:beta-xylosidase